MKLLKKIKKPKPKVDVESHGELIDHVDDVIKPEILTEENFKREEIQAEEIPTEGMTVDNVDENGIPQFSDEQRKQMKEQVNQMKR